MIFFKRDISHTTRLESLAKEAMTSQKQDPSHLEVVAVSGGLWLGLVVCPWFPFLMQRWSKSYYIHIYTLYILPSVLAPENHVMKKKKHDCKALWPSHHFFVGIFSQPSQRKTQEPTWNRYALPWLHVMVTSMASWSRLRRRKSPVQPRFSSIESSGANLVGTGNGQIGRFAQPQGQTNSLVPVIIEVEMTGIQFSGWPFG